MLCNTPELSHSVTWSSSRSFSKSDLNLKRACILSGYTDLGVSSGWGDNEGEAMSDKTGSLFDVKKVLHFI